MDSSPRPFAEPRAVRQAAAVHVGIAAALSFLIVWAYFPVRHFPFVGYDDPTNILDEPHVVGGLSRSDIRWAMTTFQLGIWAPFTQMTYLCDSQFWALRPGPMHVENVILHICGTLALYALLAFSTGAAGRSAFAAALFAVHPMHVESVAWITERRDVLSAPFLFGAMFCYCRFVRSSGMRTAAGWYVAALVSYGLSLTAKATGMTAPVVLLLLDFWPLRRRWSDLRTVLLDKIPFAALAIPAALIAVHGQKSAGAMASLMGTPLSLRLGNTIVSYVEYLAKLTFPVDLCVLYPFPADGRPAAEIVSAALLLALFAGMAVRFGPTRPYLLTGFAWFLIVLAPVSGITQAGLQSMADRYSYLASVGFFIVVAWGGFDLIRLIFGQGSIAMRLAGSSAIAIAVILAVAARYQLQYWRDTRALFARAVATTDGNWSMQYHLGLIDARDGNYAAAGKLFAEVITEKPNFPDVYIDYGNVLYLSSPYQALPAYDRAVQLDPTSVRALVNRANARRVTGDARGARADYNAARRLDSSVVIPGP